MSHYWRDRLESCLDKIEELEETVRRHEEDLEREAGRELSDLLDAYISDSLDARLHALAELRRREDERKQLLAENKELLQRMVKP